MKMNLNVKSENVSKIADLLRSTVTPLKISGTGKSMYPFFIDPDYVKVSFVTLKDIKVGEIAVFYNKNKNLYVHRVFAKTEQNGEISLLTKGDSLGYCDEPITTEQLIGKVTGLKSKTIFFYILGIIGLNRFVGLFINRIGYIMKVYNKLKK